jgi:peptidoglycan/xylan/chitin deacetylase (PgdA/CDA1 family)
MLSYRPVTWLYLLVSAVLLVLVLRTAISWYWLLLPLMAYVSILVPAAMNIQWDFFIKGIHRGKGTKKQVALTFDDGPAAYTGTILDVLKAAGAPATFFLIGKNIPGGEALVQRMDAEGHLVGNHSFEHGFWFDLKSAKGMLSELRLTDTLVKELTGKTLRWFRPPYGVTNPNVARAAVRGGYEVIGWSLRSLDTVAKEPSLLLQRLQQQTHNGAVILLHDSCAITAEVLPAYLQWLKENGYEVAALNKLIQHSPYA